MEQIRQIEHIPITVYETIYKTITSQDFQQITNMVISVSIELYRVMVSSLLLLFIPQSCGDAICTLSDNMNETDKQYKIGFIINWITVSAFILMYITEIRREAKLIKLLEVNNTISTDNESVRKRIQIFQEYKKEQLFQVDKHYQYASIFVTFVFIANTAYSWKVIYVRTLGNQTLLNFVTNILFMVSKLTNVVGIINTEKNVFFSAYLNTKVQFNDIDPREVAKIKRRSVPFITILDSPYQIEMVDGGGFNVVGDSSEHL
jgi:hypothetical protein